MAKEFDFPASRRAVEQKDVSAWAGFFADNAEWIEYKPNLSTHSRRRLIGKDIAQRRPSGNIRAMFPRRSAHTAPMESRWCFAQERARARK
jgi:hypothetical protein